MTEPMSDERLAEIEAGWQPADDAMHSGCTDYACYCHFILPELISEVKRLRAENKYLRENYTIAEFKL